MTQQACMGMDSDESQEVAQAFGPSMGEAAIRRLRRWRRFRRQGRQILGMGLLAGIMPHGALVSGSAGFGEQQQGLAAGCRR